MQVVVLTNVLFVQKLPQAESLEDMQFYFVGCIVPRT